MKLPQVYFEIFLNRQNDNLCRFFISKLQENFRRNINSNQLNFQKLYPTEMHNLEALGVRHKKSALKALN